MFEKIIWPYQVVNRYLFKDTKYFLMYLYRYFQNNHHNNCLFYSDKEFVSALTQGKSIIRIGDGEMGLIHFCPVRYQVYSDEIRNDFLKIIKNYDNNSKYIIAIPPPVNYTNAQLKKIHRFYLYRQFKITYELIFNQSVKYFDQLAFYKNRRFENLVAPYIKNKKVVIVTNADHKIKIQNSPLSSSSYQYIICENENTYESRKTIQQDIINLIDKTGLPKSDFVILMSAGLAKTITYDLSHMGYQILDIGKGLESYYMGLSIENLM